MSQARANEKKIRALLSAHACPVQFHEVRTRFLGNIASPTLGVSPIPMIQSLWGGNLPPIDDVEAIRELLGALLDGLWNPLTRHQEHGNPFRLLRASVPKTRAGVVALTLIRRQEVDGFVEGLFFGAAEVELPPVASDALGTLGEMRAMISALHENTTDSKPATAEDIAATFRNLHALSAVIEAEINRAVLDCTRARKALLASLGPGTRH